MPDDKEPRWNSSAALQYLVPLTESLADAHIRAFNSVIGLKLSLNIKAVVTKLHKLRFFDCEIQHQH
jgi:hypothetical protein